MNENWQEWSNPGYLQEKFVKNPQMLEFGMKVQLTYLDNVLKVFQNQSRLSPVEWMSPQNEFFQENSENINCERKLFKQK